MTRSTPCVRTPFDTAVLATTIVFTFVATVFVAIRLLVTHRSPLNTWRLSETWFIIAALIMCYACTVQIICAVAITGVKCYRSGVSLEWASKEIGKLLWLDIFLLIPAMGLSKISVLEFYKRIFRPRSVHWTSNAMILVISGWMAAAIVAQGFSSTPISESWHIVTHHTNYNYDYTAFTLAVFGINIGLDLIVLCLGVWGVIKYPMQTSKKLQTFGIFVLGIFSLVCAILRLYYADRSLRLSSTQHDELAYNVGRTALWGRMEPLATTIAACIPLLATPGPISRTIGSLFLNAKSSLSLRRASHSKAGSNSSKNGKFAFGFSPASTSDGHTETSSSNWSEAVNEMNHTNHQAIARMTHHPSRIPSASSHEINVTREVDVCEDDETFGLWR